MLRLNVRIPYASLPSFNLSLAESSKILPIPQYSYHDDLLYAKAYEGCCQCRPSMHDHTQTVVSQLRQKQPLQPAVDSLPDSPDLAQSAAVHGPPL